MRWTKPTFVEIRIGFEASGYVQNRYRSGQRLR